MEKKVLNYIKANKMLQRGDSVVLGVSGGADSLLLLIILDKLSKELALKLTAVHVNHHVRGKEGDLDQKFVEDVCKDMGVDCQVYHINMEELAEKNKCSPEEAGRLARYEIFDEVKRNIKADKIAVAHNLNDNSETILFNLFRGAGIRGLSGIKAVRDDIIRPILCLTRKEIENYLKDEDIMFCNDSTNKSDDYTRNRIRNRVLTYAESEINANAIVNVSRAGDELAEIDAYLEGETEKAFETCVVRCERGYFVNEKFNQLDIVIKKRIIRRIFESLTGRLKDITREHTVQVLDIFSNSVGKRTELPYGIVAVRGYDGLTIMLKEDNESETTKKSCDNLWSDEVVIYAAGKIKACELIGVSLKNMEELQRNIPNLVYTKWIDCDKIKGGLTVRTRRAGDYIVVDDKGSVKKLKDYFINEKIPKDDRDDIILVADGSHVVWIVGYRISSHYKITNETTKVLELNFKG